MFSGVGGFELGIGDRGQCVGYSEIDKYAIKVYERHFEHENYGDATTIDVRRFNNNKFDLVVGGFPCQSFSVAGKRLGFADTRGTMFYHIARILRHERPGHLLLENVKGLLSHDAGKTFQTILGILTGMGYDVEWQVLNSKDFGVPQNRERVFIVGHLGGVCGGQVFPTTIPNRQNDEASSQEQTRGSWVSTLDARYGQRWSSETYVRTTTIGPDNHKGQNKPDTNNTSRRQTRSTRQPLRFLERNQRKIEGDYAFTVDASQTGGIKTGDRIRRLTPKECERLQGFPDDWTKCGDIIKVINDDLHIKE
jgi:DNA (cytosine-5)-methyltransferase 1